MTITNPRATLHALAAAAGMSRAAADDLLAAIVAEQDRHADPVADLIARAGILWGVRPEDITGWTRTSQATAARFAVMHALRSAGYSLPECGRLLDRHHSTVLDGVRRAAAIAAGDAAFAERLRTLEGA